MSGPRFERARLSITGVLRFMPDPEGDGEHAGFHKESVDTRLWREVETPAGYEAFGPEFRGYEGSGWFAKRIQLPDPWRDGRVYLRGEGVTNRARIGVNGSLVLEESDGFLPFAKDITHAVKWDAENLIIIHADDRPRPEALPGTRRGWRNGGGLPREIWLESAPAVHLSKVSARADAPDGAARLRVRATVTNASLEDWRGLFMLSLNHAGQPLDMEPHGRRLSIKAARHEDIELEAAVSGAELWAPGQPHLYDLKVGLVAAERDVWTAKVGFRDVRVEDGAILVNRKRTAWVGFNRHEETAARGMAVDPSGAAADLRAMAEAGANCVRLCHYPHDPSTLALCDAMGLMVLAEIPLYWWAGASGSDAEAHVSGEKFAGAVRQIGRLIERDGHHPSIVAWSVSNETDDRQADVAEGNQRLIQHAKRLDPTRLVFHVSDKWPVAPQFEADDVLAINFYPSTFHNTGIRQRVDLDAVEQRWRREIETLRSAYPGKPVVVTEFGYPALPGVRNGSLGEDIQAAVLRRELAVLRDLKVAGALVWVWRDHGWPPGLKIAGDVQESPFGVVTRMGRDKVAKGAVAEAFLAWQPRDDRNPKAKAKEDATGPAGVTLLMRRDHLRNLPEETLPAGYRLRPMGRGDTALWVDVQRDAEPYFEIEDDAFETAFGDDWEAVGRRCFLLIAPNGLAVGTISAWYDRDREGADWGRIHWVALRPAVQGKGLGKGMMASALRVLAQWHDRAFLVTQSKRVGAIGLYAWCGFRPWLGPNPAD